MPQPSTLIRLSLLLVSCGFLIGCGGYGKVSPGAYQSATALFSACKAKTNDRLDKVEAFIQQQPVLSEADLADSATNVDHKQKTGAPLPADLPITATEKSWLQQIIADARQGNWESAAKSCRRIMEDQVEY
jgi:hypothetical protein